MPNATEARTPDRNAVEGFTAAADIAPKLSSDLWVASELINMARTELQGMGDPNKQRFPGLLTEQGSRLAQLAVFDTVAERLGYNVDGVYDPNVQGDEIINPTQLSREEINVRNPQIPLYWAVAHGNFLRDELEESGYDMDPRDAVVYGHTRDWVSIQFEH